MQHVIHKQKSLAIAYDRSMVEAPSVDYFDIEFWKSKNALSGKAIGRGSAWFIDAPFGPVVLRQYLRGGWVAKILSVARGKEQAITISFKDADGKVLKEYFAFAHVAATFRPLL